MLDGLSRLLEKIRLGEDSTIEFKHELPQSENTRHGLADEIAAFANSKGGVIVVGVDDDGTIVGIADQKLAGIEELVVELCNDSIEPPLYVLTEKLKIDSLAILKIEVPASMFVHRSPNGYFVRHGSSKRQMSTDYLARLMQVRSQTRYISFDKQAVPNSGIQTLRTDLYQRFITDGNSDEISELLRKRSLLVEGGDGYRASVAGILLCCMNPRDHLSNAFIQAVCYRGTTQDANYQLDAQDITGPLDQQISDAYKFVAKHNQVAARKNLGRIDYPQYNARAIFEALVNAVVHRDYSRQIAKIRLFMFADRLELYSPGSLANSLTIEALRYEQATRNDLLARLLSELYLPENLGREVERESGKKSSERSERESGKKSSERSERESGKKSSERSERESGKKASCVAQRKFLEQRGEGVPIILKESTALSGKEPRYEMIHEEELRLTIFAAEPPS